MQRKDSRPVEWAGVIVALALLAMLLGQGSPGFSLTNDGIWTLASHFPKSQQQKIEKKQKDKRAKAGGKQAKDSTPVAGVPDRMLGLYRAQGDIWPVIAGIYEIESDHGRSHAPGVHSGVNTFGCCSGPGQFSKPTWRTWGNGGNVYDPKDSVPATARMLRYWYHQPVTRTCSGTGLSARMVNAIRHYNDACWYVKGVAKWAREYNKRPPKGITFTSSHGCNPRADWLAGRPRPELRGLLTKLAVNHRIRISCLNTGHSDNVKGTNRGSIHKDDLAADVDMVDGVPVSPQHPSTALAEDARNLGAAQIGGPVVVCGSNERTPGGNPRCFTNQGHKGHWHLDARGA